MVIGASNFEIEDANFLHGEEGLALVAGSRSESGSSGSRRSLGIDDSSSSSSSCSSLWSRLCASSYNNYATYGKWGAFFFGLIMLVATYEFGVDVGRGEGGFYGSKDRSDPYAQSRPLENITTPISTTATAAETPIPPSPHPTTSTTTTKATTTTTKATSATPIPPSPHPTTSTTTTKVTATTTKATSATPIPPSPHPTATATIASIAITPEPAPDSTTYILEPNPFVAKFNTTEWMSFHKTQQLSRAQNAIDIKEKYGTYCSEKSVPMCPPLAVDDKGAIILPSEEVLKIGPLIVCNETGAGGVLCGRGDPWLNKTIWPLLRGPFCASQDAEQKAKYPLPTELAPYMDLGYDRDDPTKSEDAVPFDGFKGTSSALDPKILQEHFLKFEAMLEHYYEGLARPLLERQIAPTPDDPLYGPMLRAYSDQISRAFLRATKAKAKGESEMTKMVIGVLGDSVTSGTDNCYYDAWPEALRRQIAPLFAAMGIDVEIRNAAKNGGWNLASQMLCAHDMLGVSDRPDDLGLDFLFVCNPFVHSAVVDAEHLIRRALLGNSHTVISITVQDQKTMSKEAFLEMYAGAGLTIGTPFQDAVPELGIPDRGYKFWFPDQGRAFWGMQGDGFCHLTTRAGSSAIVNRNWHWGPKLHQTYSDAYALLFSRAARQALDDLSAGRMSAVRLPPEPPKPGDYSDTILQRKDKEKSKDDENVVETPPTWKELLLLDMSLEEAVSTGLGGVRCAVGSANQPGSTLLPDWLRPAEGSPFEEKMKSRNGASFVPADHDAVGSKFYITQSPISPPNGPVKVGEWVANPNTFGAEAPRTSKQCRHVDGSTMVNMNYKGKPSGISWLVWEVPPETISIGRAMICHPRTSKSKLAEDSFDKGDVRVHYAVPGEKDGWKMVEDAHELKPVTFVGQECTPVVAEMDEADVRAAREGGMWIAVEWKKEGIFDFDYLVAM